MTGHCKNPTNWPEVALGTMIVTRCPPGGKFNPHCCMYNPHLLEMDTWKYPLLLAHIHGDRDYGGRISKHIKPGEPLNFTGNIANDWEIISAYVNVIAEHGSGIIIDDTSNPLSDLANKILEAVQNKDLTIISATATCVTGVCGYTTLHKVVAGHHPEMVEKLKTDP